MDGVGMLKSVFANFLTIKFMLIKKTEGEILIFN